MNDYTDEARRALAELGARLGEPRARGGARDQPHPQPALRFGSWRDRLIAEFGSEAAADAYMAHCAAECAKHDAEFRRQVEAERSGAQARDALPMQSAAAPVAGDAAERRSAAAPVVETNAPAIAATATEPVEPVGVVGEAPPTEVPRTLPSSPMLNAADGDAEWRRREQRREQAERIIVDQRLRERGGRSLVPETLLTRAEVVDVLMTAAPGIDAKLTNLSRLKGADLTAIKGLDGRQYRLGELLLFAESMCWLNRR